MAALDSIVARNKEWQPLLNRLLNLEDKVDETLANDGNQQAIEVGADGEPAEEPRGTFVNYFKFHRQEQWILMAESLSCIAKCVAQCTRYTKCIKQEC